MSQETRENRGVLEFVASAFTAVGNYIGQYCSIREKTLRDQTEQIREEPGVIDVLTLRSVVEWLTENRPAAKNINAVLLRTQHAEGLRLTTVFITPSGVPLTDDRGHLRGRVQRALEIDRELQEFFGNRNMLLFK